MPKQNVVDSLPVPRPCAVCGRLTTQWSPELGMAFCGREEPPEPSRTVTEGEFAPPVRGGRPRRLSRRRR